MQATIGYVTTVTMNTSKTSIIAMETDNNDY